MTAQLLPGAKHFIVTEEPAYEASGAGEHLYVEIEKEGLNTDQVADALAKVCGRKSRDVGYAGRKDRHAITRQWFSVHFGKEDGLTQLAERCAPGTVRILSVTRHSNKLRLGHLAGNRFRLGISDAPADLAARAAELAASGIVNRFGAQRFGLNHANLHIAQAWGNGDYHRAVAYIVDPSGKWQTNDPLPSGFRHGPEGHVLGALRHGREPEAAIHAGGDHFRKLIASAAQSAICNAVIDARASAGLLHTLRVGDVGCTRQGAPFILADSDVADTNARAARGSLQAFATAPMPGTQRLRPSAEIEAEERQWSADTGMNWDWFAQDGVFVSPGERRPVVVPCREPPMVETTDECTWLTLSLPAGTYATMVLEQLGIAVPSDRRGPA